MLLTKWTRPQREAPSRRLPVDLPGQSFDITHVPNGTYYVEIVANPEKVLYETTARNDTSLRKVILGGTPGHRTVKVPAFHGIDPEP